MVHLYDILRRYRYPKTVEIESGTLTSEEGKQFGPGDRIVVYGGGIKLYTTPGDISLLQSGKGRELFESEYGNFDVGGKIRNSLFVPNNVGFKDTDYSRKKYTRVSELLKERPRYVKVNTSFLAFMENDEMKKINEGEVLELLFNHVDKSRVCTMKAKIDDKVIMLNSDKQLDVESVFDEQVYDCDCVRNGRFTFPRIMAFSNQEVYQMFGLRTMYSRFVINKFKYAVCLSECLDNRPEQLSGNMSVVRGVDCIDEDISNLKNVRVKVLKNCVKENLSVSFAHDTGIDQEGFKLYDVYLQQKDWPAPSNSIPFTTLDSSEESDNSDYSEPFVPSRSQSRKSNDRPPMPLPMIDSPVDSDSDDSSYDEPYDWLPKQNTKAGKGEAPPTIPCRSPSRNSNKQIPEPFPIIHTPADSDSDDSSYDEPYDWIPKQNTNAEKGEEPPTVPRRSPSRNSNKQLPVPFPTIHSPVNTAKDENAKPRVPSRSPSRNSNKRHSTTDENAKPRVPSRSQSRKSNKQHPATDETGQPRLPSRSPSRNSNKRHSAIDETGKPRVPSRSPSRNSNKRNSAIDETGKPRVPSRSPSRNSNKRHSAIDETGKPRVPSRSPSRNFNKRPSTTNQKEEPRVPSTSPLPIKPFSEDSDSSDYNEPVGWIEEETQKPCLPSVSPSGESNTRLPLPIKPSSEDSDSSDYNEPLGWIEQEEEVEKPPLPPRSDSWKSNKANGSSIHSPQMTKRSQQHLPENKHTLLTVNDKRRALSESCLVMPADDINMVNTNGSVAVNSDTSNVDEEVFSNYESDSGEKDGIQRYKPHGTMNSMLKTSSLPSGVLPTKSASSATKGTELTAKSSISDPQTEGPDAADKEIVQSDRSDYNRDNTADKEIVQSDRSDSDQDSDLEKLCLDEKSVSELVEFFDNQKLTRLGSICEEHNIDGSFLVTMTDEDLKNEPFCLSSFELRKFKWLREGHIPKL